MVLLILILMRKIIVRANWPKPLKMPNNKTHPPLGGGSLLTTIGDSMLETKPIFHEADNGRSEIRELTLRVNDLPPYGRHMSREILQLLHRLLLSTNGENKLLAWLREQ